MQAHSRSNPLWYSTRLTATILVLAGMITVVFIVLAPTERTLGSGIRTVYLHVALIWVGMAGLFLAGGLGLAVLATRRHTLARWMEAVAWVSFLFYTLSGLVSLVAQEVNWGGISWREPRTEAMIQLVALALIVRVLNSWFADVRLQGLLNLLVVAALFWSSRTTSVLLHPEDAVGSSTANAIRLSFFGLTALLALVAAWLVLYWRARRT
jgi:hypothetical protein